MCTLRFRSVSAKMTFTAPCPERREKQVEPKLPMKPLQAHLSPLTVDIPDTWPTSSAPMYSHGNRQCCELLPTREQDLRGTKWAM